MMGYARNGCPYVLSIILIDSDLMRQRVVIFIMAMSLKNALSHITKLPVNVKKHGKIVFPQLSSTFCVMLHCYNRLFRETRKKIGPLCSGVVCSGGGWSLSGHPVPSH